MKWIIMANTVKIPAETWIETAQKALVNEGLGGIRVDRLAKNLGVTRGGFYHHFKNHQDLLDRLIKHWASSNDLLPDMSGVETTMDALAALEALGDRLIEERSFSPAFEMAVREWARIDKKVSRTVNKVDKQRIEKMSAMFEALGYDEEEAGIRARVYYFHQIGYYSLGYHKHQSKSERKKNSPVYFKILCGHRYIEAAKKKAPK